MLILYKKLLILILSLGLENDIGVFWSGELIGHCLVLHWLLVYLSCSGLVDPRQLQDPYQWAVSLRWFGMF